MQRLWMAKFKSLRLVTKSPFNNPYLTNIYNTMKKIIILILATVLLTSCGMQSKKQCIEYTELVDIEFLTVWQWLIWNDKTYTILKYKNWLVRKIDWTWVQNIGQKHCVKY